MTSFHRIFTGTQTRELFHGKTNTRRISAFPSIRETSPAWVTEWIRFTHQYMHPLTHPPTHTHTHTVLGGECGCRPQCPIPTGRMIDTFDSGHHATLYSPTHPRKHAVHTRAHACTHVLPNGRMIGTHMHQLLYAL